jgi:hypothetical protein
MQEDPTAKEPYAAVEKRLQKAAQTKIKAPNAVSLKEYSGLITPIVKMLPTDFDLVFKAFASHNGRYVYLTDVIETTKAHVSLPSKSTNKARFSNLNDLIPGYYQMSPRSKCDSAVSQLIKEMKRHNVKATAVFRMAGSSGGSSVYSGQIKTAFIKLAPAINPDLIRDAMLSFGTADATAVTEAQFCNVFDEQFDKSVGANVPNSRQSGSLTQQSTKKGGSMKRPASAAAPQGCPPAEARRLVQKFDNAMLRQQLSPVAAFTAACAGNEYGVITVAELREAVKTLLPEEQFTPADLKMTMLAFDANGHGRIEREEFIAVITEARNQGLQGMDTLNDRQAEPYEEASKFERPSTGGFSRAAASGGLSAE